ncbi:MAG: winged helix-turn-helix transcriptional regulator [bacterium]
MPNRTCRWLLGLAALVCCPVVAALSVGQDQPLQAVDPAVAAVPVLADGTHLNTSLPAAVADLGVADVQVRATGRVTVLAAPIDVTTGDSPSPSAASRPSLGDQVSAVAVPVAGGAIAAFLLAALAYGIDGVRAGQARLSGLFGRLGRAAAGLVVGLPLFSRIARGKLLDNPVRARVHEVITQDPGLSLSDVRTRTGIAWGTAVHHLRRLEDNGMVVSVSQLSRRRYFAADTPAASQRTAMAVVMHPTARRIANLVSQQPGLDQTAICQTLGLNNPSASKHLRQFAGQGLVLVERDGRSRIYRPTIAMHSALSLLDPVAAVVTIRPTALAATPVPGAW